MEILLDDYKRRLETALNLLGNTSNNGGIYDTKKLERIRTKISCYRTFIAELEREMANVKQRESNFAIPVVIARFLTEQAKKYKIEQQNIVVGLMQNDLFVWNFDGGRELQYQWQTKDVIFDPLKNEL